MTQQAVLDFLEHLSDPPAKISVERTEISKYQFYLIVRHVRKRLNTRPLFHSNSKESIDRVRALLEEHSILNDRAVHVLEGFDQRFVDTLSLPQGVYVVAETKGGELKAEPYHQRQKRNILRVLQTQLGLGKLSLRELLKLDWSSMRGFEDYEPVLRKAKIMNWSEEQIGQQLRTSEPGHMLSLIKRSQMKDVMEAVRRNGATWALNHVTSLLADLAQWRALRSMGFDEARTSRDMGVGYSRALELEEANKTLSSEDLDAMIAFVIKQDRLAYKYRELAVELLMLNAPIRLRK